MWGAVQAPHSHENSWISGTYEVCFEEGHAPIRFWRHGALVQPIDLSFDGGSGLAHHLQRRITPDFPSARHLLLWPSHLLYGNSGKARNWLLSLSINLLLQRLIGSSYSLEVSPLKSND